jgi:phosphatidate cytidylyltransferase
MARLLSAIVSLPILFGVLWWGEPIWFVLIAAIAILLGLYEYQALTRPAGLPRAETSSQILSRVLSLIAASAVLAAFYFERLDRIVIILATYVIIEMLLQLYTNLDRDDLSHVLHRAAVNVFGVLYIAVLGGHIVALRMIERGRLAPQLLTLFFMIIFAGDTGAYYTGRTLGRHKLAPEISPGKTVEGAIGGLISNVIAAVIAHYTFFPELRLGYATGLALGMGLLAIAGDLCESMLKRGAKAKDAGKIIPGHGGLLDRLDSMLFNAPLLYYFYVVFTE